MAELNQGREPQKGERKVRSKKHSVRIDMTPMVDLAFLLLTFFILTSTLTRHQVMDVTMPDDVETPQPINEKNILNLVIAEDNKIYWWQGLNSTAAVTNFSKDGIRKLLLKSSGANPKLMVIIKPRDESKYENMVDILDEIAIAHIERYAIVDFTDDDKTIISEISH